MKFTDFRTIEFSGNFPDAGLPKEGLGFWGLVLPKKQRAFVFACCFRCFRRGVLMRSRKSGEKDRSTTTLYSKNRLTCRQYYCYHTLRPTTQRASIRPAGRHDDKLDPAISLGLPWSWRRRPTLTTRGRAAIFYRKRTPSLGFQGWHAELTWLLLKEPPGMFWLLFGFAYCLFAGVLCCFVPVLNV